MSRRGWVLFLSLSVIWGIPYLLIRVSVASLEPAFIVFGRVLIAALLLLPLAAARGELRQLRRHWPWVLVFTLVEITVTWPAVTIAERTLTSSFTALMVSAVPLAGAFLAWRLGMDRLTGSRLAGLFIGILGVAALVGLDFGELDIAAVALLAIVVMGYAYGPVVVARHLSDVPSLGVIAAAMVINTVLFAPLAWLQRPTGPVPPEAWWSLLGLGVVCTAVAFLLFFALVAEVGPSRMTVITYLNPVVALALGVAILGEPITAGMIVGFPLVIVGSILATRHPPAEDTEQTPVAHTG